MAPYYISVHAGPLNLFVNFIYLFIYLIEEMI